MEKIELRGCNGEPHVIYVGDGKNLPVSKHEWIDSEPNENNLSRPRVIWKHKPKNILENEVIQRYDPRFEHKRENWVEDHRLNCDVVDALEPEIIFLIGEGNHGYYLDDKVSMIEFTEAFAYDSCDDLYRKYNPFGKPYSDTRLVTRDDRIWVESFDDAAKILLWYALRRDNCPCGIYSALKSLEVNGRNKLFGSLLNERESTLKEGKDPSEVYRAFFGGGGFQADAVEGINPKIIIDLAHSEKKYDLIKKYSAKME